MKRYDRLALAGESPLVEDPEGAWVRWEDHEAECERLREVATKAQETLENIRIREAELDAMCEEGWEKMRENIKLESDQWYAEVAAMKAERGREQR